MSFWGLCLKNRFTFGMLKVYIKTGQRYLFLTGKSVFSLNVQEAEPRSDG